MQLDDERQVAKDGMVHLHRAHSHHHQMAICAAHVAWTHARGDTDALRRHSAVLYRAALSCAYRVPVVCQTCACRVPVVCQVGVAHRWRE